MSEGYTDMDFINEADLREARAEISRHHELIKQMREGVALLYDAYQAVSLGAPADVERGMEIDGFMSWFHRNVG